MFSASITTGSPPGEALGDAGAEPDGLGSPLGEAGAEPLGDTLGIGVADGAGAYAHPGAGAEHALNARAATTAGRSRTDRIRAEDLRVARMTAVGCARRCYRVRQPRVGGVPRDQDPTSTIVRIARRGYRD
jgi:hypothetical protein